MKQINIILTILSDIKHKNFNLINHREYVVSTVHASKNIVPVLLNYFFLRWITSGHKPMSLSVI